MKKVLFIILLFFFNSLYSKDKEDIIKLWYDSPASNWNEALPIGNGRLGAMIFGDVKNECLQLNENTLYSGEPSTMFTHIEVTSEIKDKVISLLKSHEYSKASDIVCKKWFGRLHQYYQPLGDLYIKDNITGEISDYRRELILSEGINRTVYRINNVSYVREIFASNPDDVIVIHIKTDKKERIDLSLSLSSVHPTAKSIIRDNKLVLYGQAPGYVERRTFEQIEKMGDQYKHPELYDNKGNRKYNKTVLYGDEINGLGTFFEAQIRPVCKNGKVEYNNNELRITATDEVYILLSMATSFNGFEKSPSIEGVDLSLKATMILDKAILSDYKDLKQRHVKDFSSLFNRVSLELESSAEQISKPTDQRIDEFADLSDPDLAATLFQYGRYLMISGSRPGGQPLNLQGMWNKDVVPAWNCGYTMNINAEMNYWPAEITNLSECHEPFFRLISELAINGRKTAKQMYKSRGWVAHHNTSIWRETMPNDYSANAAFWPMVQGWLTNHLWEHYQFTQDEIFLKEKVYPLIKGAAEFFSDWLIDDGNGNLVTPVGVSPENTFITEKGELAAMCMGPTMDMAIIRENFKHTIEISEKLGLDSCFRNELKNKLHRLLPYKIGKMGQLQEWMYDFKETEPTHRHLSHLYGFYPGNQITPDTPELFNAVKRSLEIRGDEANGWSMGWKINCWARQMDGNHAYKIISNLFNPIGYGSGRDGGGLYKNMLDACPPFQIDGNFGYTSGVAEMLLQSHAGYIHLLPVLPDAWSNGKITGLKARGNFEVDIIWNKGQLRSSVIKSLSGNSCKIRSQWPFVVMSNDSIIVKCDKLKYNKIYKYYECEIFTKSGDLYQIKGL